LSLLRLKSVGQASGLEFLCYCVKAEFLLHEITIIPKAFSYDWKWATHIVEDNLVYIKSSDYDR
jgi:hypothetical protein